MEQVLIGISLALLGFVVCFFGLRFWYYLLPLVGAAVGFFAGARVIQDVFGGGFLSTAISWILGIILAVGLAFLSRMVWYVGVIVLAFALGVSLSSAILHAILGQPWEWVLLIVAAVAGCVFAAGAIALDVPVQIVIFGSAVVGAAFMVAGVMTLLGTITVEELRSGPAAAIVDQAQVEGGSWLWTVGWIVLAVAGCVYQRQSLAAIRLPDARWIPARAV
jgi:Domain of unknown function (DUF4203)